MLRNRRQRRDARKIAKLARALAALDDQARLARPSPRRAAKISFSP
jgi:hypothetical protein